MGKSSNEEIVIGSSTSDDEQTRADEEDPFIGQNLSHRISEKKVNLKFVSLVNINGLLHFDLAATEATLKSNAEFAQALHKGNENAQKVFKDILRHLAAINQYTEALGNQLRQHQGEDKILNTATTAQWKQYNPRTKAGKRAQYAAATIPVLQQHERMMNDFRDGLNDADAGKAMAAIEKFARYYRYDSEFNKEYGSLKPMVERDHDTAAKIGVWVALTVAVVIAIAAFLPLATWFPDLIPLGALGALDLSFIAPTVNYCLSVIGVSLATGTLVGVFTGVGIAHRKGHQNTRGAISSMKQVAKKHGESLLASLQEFHNFSKSEGIGDNESVSLLDEDEPASSKQFSNIDFDKIKNQNNDIIKGQNDKDNFPVKVITLEHGSLSLCRFNIAATRAALMKNFKKDTPKEQRKELNRYINTLDNRLTKFNQRTEALTAELKIWQSKCDPLYIQAAKEIITAHTTLVCEIQKYLCFIPQPLKRNEISQDQNDISSYNPPDQEQMMFDIKKAVQKFNEDYQDTIRNVDAPVEKTNAHLVNEWLEPSNSICGYDQKAAFKTWGVGFGLGAFVIAAAAAFIPLMLISADTGFFLFAGIGTILAGGLGGLTAGSVAAHYKAHQGARGAISDLRKTAAKSSEALAEAFSGIAQIAPPA